MVYGKSEIRELLERIAKLNRDDFHNFLELEETESGWAKAA